MTVTRRRLAGLTLAAAGAWLGARPAEAASIVPSGQRVCATCAFWKGPRLPSMDRRSVIVANGAKGRCANPDSPLAGLETQPGQGHAEGWRRMAGLM